MQSSEAKETTDPENKTTEDKTVVNQAPALTKEEEEELAQQRKEDRKRKDQEFLNQVAKALSRSAIQPLGRDRVFRRYWAFKTMRGLFVEDDDPDQHLLLEPESDSESEVRWLNGETCTRLSKGRLDPKLNFNSGFLFFCSKAFLE